MDQIILFGDSLTQFSFSQATGFGFGAALADAYVRRLDVINRGYSGYNTRQALAVLPSILPPPPTSPAAGRPRLMTVFLGANDARLPDSPGGPQQHVPLSEYRANLRAILTHDVVRAHGSALRLVLITPPPVDERNQAGVAVDKYGGAGVADVELNRTAATTKRYAEAAREVGRETGVVVLDLWTAMMERAGGQVGGDGNGKEGEGDVLGSREATASPVLQGYLYDGLHFTPAAYRVLFEEFTRLIRSTWPDLDPEKLPFVLPTWDNALWTRENGISDFLGKR